VSDFSDDYFSKLRAAIAPPVKTTDRDVINRAMQYGDQEQPRAQIVEANGGAGPGSPAVFTLANQWAQVLLLVPQQVNGFVRLIGEGGPFYCGPKPFYVAGVRQFQNDTGSPLLVQTASREELLSDAPSRDYVQDGAGFSELYDSANPFTVAILSGSWAYLGPDLEWTTAPINTLPSSAYQFGWAAPDKAKAGRFYAGEFFIVSSAPATTFQLGICYELQTTPVGVPVSASLTANAGTFRVGDVGAALVAAGVFGAADGTQRDVQCPSKFAVVLRPLAAVATTFTGEMKMIRRGF